MLTLGAIIGRDDSREFPIATKGANRRGLYVDAGDKETPGLSERICTEDVSRRLDRRRA